MNEMQKSNKGEKGVIDKKRVFIGFLVLALVLTGIVYWGKDALPQFKASVQKITTVKQNNGGEIAGASDAKEQLKAQREEVQGKIDEIKSSITSLKPEDIKNQGPVKKILSDLDDLEKQASASMKIFDIKGNICEEAKKRFC